MATTTSSSVILTGGWQPRTDAERSSVLRYLDQILSNSVFRSSKRYPALLKFIVEETLEGRGDALKERVLGVEVFGRPSDYDTGSDHVVRTSAGEVRKRLAQYYLNDGCDDSIRIDIPAGSYVAQFRLISQSPVLEPVVTHALPALAPAVPSSRWRWPIIASVAANVILVVALAVSNISWSPGTSTLQKFWEPVFASKDSVLICVGLRDGQAATQDPDPLRHRVAMADLLALAHVTNYAGERHARYRITDPASTSFSDLRHVPTVLIGVGNNNWTKRLAGQMRYGFVMNEYDRPYAVRDTQHPGKDWVRGDERSDSFRDYAIVSRLLDPRVEQVVVVIGGVGAHGTEIAGEFVTNPDQMRKLEAIAPSGWSGKNLQVVLSTEVVKSSSGPPKIEAAYFW